MSENKFHNCSLNNDIIPDDNFVSLLEDYTPKVNFLSFMIFQ